MQTRKPTRVIVMEQTQVVARERARGMAKGKSGEGAGGWGGGYLLVVVAGKSYRLRKRNVTGQKAVSKAAAATEIMASAM